MCGIGAIIIIGAITAGTTITAGAIVITGGTMAGVTIVTGAITAGVTTGGTIVTGPAGKARSTRTAGAPRAGRLFSVAVDPLRSAA
jgi:hypothetical protein